VRAKVGSGTLGEERPQISHCFRPGDGTESWEGEWKGGERVGRCGQ
jgi:hypothetical protein